MAANSEEKTITIGLAMSGAISAGAYSAGVLDFLIEALEEWEAHRGKDNVPGHRVKIAATAGASAGSITSAIGMAAASRLDWSDEKKRRVRRGPDGAEHNLTDLYHAWVTLPDFLASPVGALLDLDDLAEVSKTAESKAAQPATTAENTQGEASPFPEKPVKSKTRVLSVLNSRPLDRIGNLALSGAFSRQQAKPKPYFAEDLHLYMTMTNLRGVPYGIEFGGPADCNSDGHPDVPKQGRTGHPYVMMSHGDRAHYRLKGIGTPNPTPAGGAPGTMTIEAPPVTTVALAEGGTSVELPPGQALAKELSARLVSARLANRSWADRDPAVDVAVSSLPEAGGKDFLEWLKTDRKAAINAIDGLVKSPDWGAYIQHTLTSSAFPVGLSARDVSLPGSNYHGRSWALPIPFHQMDAIVPLFPEKQRLASVIPFAAVDGGALDNDPFQIVRYTLMDDPHTPLKEDRAETDRLVIMISPFPEPPEYVADDVEARDNALLSVIGRMLPTFMQNARFKPMELVEALRKDDATRWLVSPRRFRKRVVDGQPVYDLEPYGIACGLLGGFGGFLDQAFREHDYQLGRRNCQDFLGKWFGLPENAKHIEASVPLPQAPLPKDVETGLFAIIPLCGIAAKPIEMMEWPRVGPEKVNTFVDHTVKRLDAVKNLLLKEAPWWASAAVKVASGIYDNTIKNVIRRKLMLELILRDQYDADFEAHGKTTAFKSLTRLQRNILAAFVTSSADYRTPGGIARDLKHLYDGLRLLEPGDTPPASDEKPAVFVEKVKAVLQGLETSGFVESTKLNDQEVYSLSGKFQKTITPPPAQIWRRATSGLADAASGVWAWGKSLFVTPDYIVD